MDEHERLGNGPNIAGTCQRNPESPSSKSNNNNNNNNSNNKEQDRFLPIANVGRLMKKVIPGNGKISKDAKETVQECVSEFISFVTGEASDKCQREKRKTINGDDIIWAITTLGFDEYVEPLKHYLLKYRELEGDKSTVNNNVPKHQQYHEQQKSIHHLPDYDAITTTSTASLLPQSLPFMPADTSFPLPNFSQAPIQSTQHIRALHQQQDRFDALERW